jgi:phosphoglycolate phosphatase-like HAD superfamily hydrolase
MNLRGTVYTNLHSQLTDLLFAVHLVLFDIDGTLTQSQSLDAEIYLRSLSDVFGFADVGSDWSTYRHTTDSGILHEIFETRLGRAPTALEISVFRTHFVAAIAVAAAQTPFREIPGAAQALRNVAGLPFYPIGLATGGWSDSARCKMRSAGMSYDAFPSASAEDAISRVSIMQIAIDRVADHIGGDRPDTVTYVGDGVWDARARWQLNIPFVGIATGKHADTLRTEGTADVFPDYSDLQEFSSALMRIRRSV